MNLKQDIKDLQRIRKILAVFFEEGLGYYIQQSKLGNYLPFHKRLTPVRPLTNRQMQAVRIRQAFERLGPTFVKLGQLLSLRPDLVPEEYSTEFEKLQDQVPSFPFAQVKAIIEEDLGKPLKSLFKQVEQRPIASASIAQVHRAILQTGENVVLKVRRPEITETINADLDILFFLAHSLEKHYPELRNYRPVAVVREFAAWTRKELNFQIEAQNAIRLKKELAKSPRVKVPKVYVEYSSSRVLTMDYIDGVKINNLAGLAKFHVDRKKIAKTYFLSILEQALLYGFFHADPHPANIFIEKNGKLVYLDFGIMGELSARDQRRVIQFIESVPEKNPEKSIQYIIAMAENTRDADITRFKQRTIPILEEVYLHPIKDRSIGRAMYEIISLGAQHGVLFNPNHVLIAKAIYQAEGLGLKLDPHFKVAEGLHAFAEEYLHTAYSPLQLARKVKTTLLEQRDLLVELPEHLQRVVERLEKPEPHEHISLEQLEQLERDMESMNRKRTMGLVITFFIIGAAFLLFLEGKKELLGLPLSVLLLLLALSLFLYSLFIHTEHKEGMYHESNSENST